MIDQQPDRQERRRYARDPHLMSEADWRREVLRQFKEGNDRFDKQDKILKTVETFMALIAAGKLGANAFMWLLKAGSLIALIMGAMWWKK